MKKQQKNCPLRFSGKKSCVSSYLLQKQKQKITRKSLKTPNYYILLWKPSSSYIFLFSRVMRKYWCINKKKVSSIAVFMQSAMYYKLMPFWTTTKKVSLFLLLNSPSFYLLLYIFYLSLDTFLLCFVFSTSIIQAQIMLTKNAAFCVNESTLVKKLLVFTFIPVFSNKNSITYFFFFLFSRDLREILFHIELLLDQVVGEEKVT